MAGWSGDLILAMSQGSEAFFVDRDGFKRAFETARRSGPNRAWRVRDDKRRPWSRRGSGSAGSYLSRFGGSERGTDGGALQDQIARRRAVNRRSSRRILLVSRGEGIDPRPSAPTSRSDGRRWGPGNAGSVIVPHSSGDPAVVMSGIYARAGSRATCLPLRVGTPFRLEITSALRFDGCSTSAPVCCARRSPWQKVKRGAAVLFAGPTRRPRAPRPRPVRGPGLAGVLEPLPGVAYEQGARRYDMDARERPPGVDRRHTSRASRGRHPKRVLDRVATYEGTTTGLSTRAARSSVFEERGRSASMRCWPSIGERGPAVGGCGRPDRGGSSSSARPAWPCFT